MDALDPQFANTAVERQADAVVSRAVVRDGTWFRAACLAGIGSAALAIGVLVYLADRTGSRAVLVPEVAMLAGHPLFGVIGQWLPSFVHPLAFSLFMAAALKPGVAARVGACAFWSAANVAFEFGQHPALHAFWAGAMQGGGRDGAVTRSVLNYFLLGTFDPFDVLAALLAAPAAVAILHLVDHRPGALHAHN